MEQRKPKAGVRRRKRVSTSERRHRFLLRLGLLIIVVLACIAAYLAFNHLRPAVNNSNTTTAGSQDFTQQSADIPLYVLVIGIDDGEMPQANFVGLAAVNKDKKTIDFIMLPDNTKIEGRKEKGAQALQDIYREGGLTLTRAVIEDIFKIPVPYYISFTKDSFSHMIDMNDGMPLYVEKPMYHEENGVTDIDLEQGYQLLTGEEAVGYMRFIDKDGFLPRAQRQERFVKAFYKEMEQHFGITNAVNVYRLWNHVDSNIAAKDMARLAWTFRNVPVEDIHFYMLPGEVAKSGETHTATADTLWNYDPVEVQKIIGTSNNAIANE